MADENIRLTGVKARECPNPLRRIAYRDPATGKGYVFLTNHFRLAAKTIADIYKERWQIEIFFHWIKQNLKINSYASHWPNRTEMILIESDQLDNVGPEEKRRPRKLAHVTFGRSNWLVQLKELCEKRG